MRTLVNSVISLRQLGRAGLIAAVAVVLGLSAQVARADDYSSKQTFYQWDNSSRLKMKIWPSPIDGGLRRAEQYSYTVDGRLDTVAVGTVDDKLGANFTVKESRSFTYDAVGNTVRVTTPSGVTQFSYDGADHVVCTAVRMTSTLNADACALAITGTDTPDRIAKAVYDAAGQVTATIQALGVTGLERTYASYGYSKNGKQTSITDAVGNRTELRYDGFDRLDRQTFPSSVRAAAVVNPDDYEAYEYDKAGNRTALRKRDGSRIDYAYNAANQLQTKSGARVRSVTYAYDLTGTGKAISAIFTGTTEGVYYTYDTAGRLESETSEGPIAGQSNYSRKLAFEIDPAGNRTGVTWPAGGGSATYTYDLAGRSEKVKDGSFELASYGYDALNRRTSLTFGNGASQTQTWDGAGRLDEWNLHLANGDRNDRRKYGYNAADQMTSETQNAPYVFVGTNGALDATADGLNRDGALVVVGGYDANQNLIGDKGHSFTYDGENRLLTASWPASAALDYDPLGRLRQTTISGTVTQFLYDGDQLAAEYDGAGNLLRRYVHGAGVDDPLVWYEGGARRWLHADRQGSVIAWSDASGVSQATYTYGPYGEPGDNWAAGSRFRYTGQIALPDLRVYHYKARVYDPARGWFLQTDPIGYGDGLNWYTYVGNDPLNGSDPTGLAKLFNFGSAEAFARSRQLLASSNPQAQAYGHLATFDAGLRLMLEQGVNGLSNFTFAVMPIGRSAPAVEATVTTVSASARASELAGLMASETRNRVTIAVTETAQGTRVVSSSEGYLRSEVQAALGGTELYGKGVAGVHAEVNGYNAATQAGLTPTGVAASRGICPSCAAFLQKKGVDILSALRGGGR